MAHEWMVGIMNQTMKAGPKLRALLAGKRVVGSGGLLAAKTSAGIVLSLAAGSGASWILRGVIVAVNGGSGDDPVNPSAVTYDVRLTDGRDGVVLLAQTPVNREIVNDEVMIRPALLDSPCFVLEYPGVGGGREYHLVAFERDAFGDCSP
jgi:hypothetical protein